MALSIDQSSDRVSSEAGSTTISSGTSQIGLEPWRQQSGHINSLNFLGTDRSAQGPGLAGKIIERMKEVTEQGIWLDTDEEAARPGVGSRSDPMNLLLMTP